MSITITTTLSELSEPEFWTITRAASPESSLALPAVWSTLSLLSQYSCSPDQISFLPSYLSLVLSSSAHNLGSIPSEGGAFIKDLTQAAHVTSASLSCSSVLAGFSSDSDQFGDVGLVIPVLETNKETEIVNLLGLAHWLRTGGKIVKCRETLPSGLAQIPQIQRGLAASQIDNLTSLLSRLHDPFQFRLEGSQDNGGTVIWFLLGTITLDDKTAWAGLLGVGTWADFE